MRVLSLTLLLLLVPLFSACGSQPGDKEVEQVVETSRALLLAQSRNQGERVCELLHPLRRAREDRVAIQTERKGFCPELYNPDPREKKRVRVLLDASWKEALETLRFERVRVKGERAEVRFSVSFSPGLVRRMRAARVNGPPPGRLTRSIQLERWEGEWLVSDSVLLASYGAQAPEVVQ